MVSQGNPIGLIFKMAAVMYSLSRRQFALALVEDAHQLAALIDIVVAAVAHGGAVNDDLGFVADADLDRIVGAYIATMQLLGLAPDVAPA